MGGLSAAGVRPLTPRQLEVLELLAKGLTNAEISGVLGIAPGTVKLHVSAVIAALGVSNRTEAAVALGELGAAREPDTGDGRVPGFGDRPAIAVLPFGALGSAEPDALAEGLSEDLTTSLASWRWFPVIARTSSFAVGNQGRDVREVARELGARYVVHGTVRRDGPRVRVSVQLIDGTTSDVLVARNFDHQADHVFDAQDEIVAAIFGALEPTLVRVEGLRATHKAPSDRTVWDSFQRGMAALRRQGKGDLATADEAFRDAIERAPDFTPALAGLALLRLTEAPQAIARAQQDGVADPGEAMRDALERVAEALRLARRAVDLDPGDSAAQGALGGALGLSLQLEQAEAAFRRALDINPSSSVASWGLGGLLLRTGRTAEAIDWCERAVRLSPQDPLSHHYQGSYATALFAAGRFAEARDAAVRSIAALPEDGVSYRALLVACCIRLDAVSEARRQAKLVFEEFPHFNLGTMKLLFPGEAADGVAAAFKELGFEVV